MSQSQLESFFEKIIQDSQLQQQLYVTSEIIEVSQIAKKMGFDVSGAEILRAQGLRVLSMSIDDQNELAAGNKPKTGAQWGREGKGYLERAGFWLLNFLEKNGVSSIAFSFNCSSTLQLLRQFFHKIQEDQLIQQDILLAKTCNDVAKIAQKNGIQLLGTDFVRYLAEQILKSNDEQVEKVAHGAAGAIA